MTLVGLFLIALSLSTDCFAAAVSRGCALKRPSGLDVMRVGLLFGLFAALMPALGWAVGTSARSLVTQIDHWIAFALLVAIGGHMVWAATHPEDAEDDYVRPLALLPLIGAAIATSIDAAAMGITFAFLDVDILRAVAVIGLVCGLIAAIGVGAARVTGPLLGRKAEIVGGLVLIVLGFKIAVEHTVEQGFLFAAG